MRTGFSTLLKAQISLWARKKNSSITAYCQWTQLRVTESGVGTFSSKGFRKMRLKTYILILLFPLIFFGCAAMPPEKPAAPEMTVDMGIDKLAREVTKSLALESRPKIAVVDLLGPNDNHTQLGSFISDKLIRKLFMSGRFEKVLERKLLRDLLVQQRIELEGYFDQDTVESIVGKIGVDAIVMGFITDYGSRVDVNVRLIDTRGEILGVGEAQIAKDQGVKNMLQGLKKATLTVAVNPSDAEASVTVGENVVKSIDGIAIFSDLAQGKRSIIITAKGYEMVQESIYLNDDRSITIPLTPRTVTLSLRIDPPQAEILFDGENKGKASQGVMVLKNVPSGKHTILARAEKHLPEAREIELYENKAISIELTAGPRIKIAKLKRGEPGFSIDISADSSAKEEALHAAFRRTIEQAVGAQITSETTPENAGVLKDKIYAYAEGFVKKWEILSERTDNQLLVLKVRASVREGRLNKALFLNGIDVQKVYEWVGNPRIVVIVEEYIDGQPSQINIAQAELEEIFRSRNITVLSSGQIEKIKKRDVRLLIEHPDHARILGNRLGAEIVVAGKCLSNFSRKVQISNFTQYFYSAYLQVQAYNTSTGEILLSSHYKNDKKADLSALGKFDAAMNAIKNCIGSAKSDIVFKIVGNWYDSFNKPETYQLFVEGITYENLQGLNRQLYALNNCRDLVVRGFEKNLAELDFKYEGTKSHLVNDLLNLKMPLTIVRETQNRIFVRFRR